jgi:hypothetical protein
VDDDRLALSNLYGLTDADLVANLPTVKANAQRLIAQRADEAKMTQVEYIRTVFLPTLIDAGPTDEELREAAAIAGGE